MYGMAMSVAMKPSSVSRSVAEKELRPFNIPKKVHGNSHSTTRTTYGYTLRDKDTGEILKYGETINPSRRYTKKYMNEHNARMVI
jgi:hypothetical protein